MKQERKINKINFNKFIWFHWKMKEKNNIFFYGLPVGGTNEKKNDVKKKKASARGLGYYPFSVCIGSRYRELYRDTRLGRQAWACDTVGLVRSRTLRHDREALRHGRSARGASGARVHGLAVGGCVMIQMGIS